MSTTIDDSASIKPIDAASVHKLNSAQVAIDLQTAVKELVENSLDAGATNIEVRFKEYGVKSIEVIDNGSGVRKADHDTIALKHYTSKIATFEDVAAVTSFGFRGEALSALCAMSESVIITTSTAEEAPKGTSLEMNQLGAVVNRSTIARQRGTTVTVTDLFKTLPVRRKEFERNAKREYAKAVALLHAYALVPSVANSVRLSVNNTTPGSGGRKVVLSVKGGSLMDSITSLWGPKSTENIVPLELDFDVEMERSIALRLGVEQTITQVQVRGLVSRFTYNAGRASADRQYLYINGRPCTHAKLQKTFNEVYKSYNTHQSPFLIADFILPSTSTDVNVSKDKRTILLHSEKALVANLKAALETSFASARSTFSVNITQSQKPIAVDKDIEMVDSDNESSSELPPPSRRLSRRKATPPTSEDEVPEKEIPKVATPSVVRPDSRSNKLQQVTLSTKGASWNLTKPVLDNGSNSPPKKKRKSHESRQDFRSSLSQYALKGSAAPVRSDIESDEDDEEEDEEAEEVSEPRRSDTRRRSSNLDDEDVEIVPQPPKPNVSRQQKFPRRETVPVRSPSPEVMEVDEDLPDTSTSFSFVDESVLKPDESLLDTSMEDEILPPETYQRPTEIIKSDDGWQAEVAFDLDKVAAAWKTRKSQQSSTVEARNGVVGDDASLSNTENNDGAAQALARVISKEDFTSMAILGQFNRGFIITRRLAHSENMDDLFIIDQHASDEKYNFETLQQTTVIESQKLLRPLKLELTAADEMIAMEQMDVLKRNGFEIDIGDNDESDERQQLSLVAQPVSKNTNFDMKDLEEIIHLLHDSPKGQMVRCSKARAMFASRACRKSVMIGHPLSESQMRAIVHHMGKLEQPWACPHGRPTMRHLTDLTSIRRQAERPIAWDSFDISL